MKIPKQAYTIQFKELAIKRIEDEQSSLLNATKTLTVDREVDGCVKYLPSNQPDVAATEPTSWNKQISLYSIGKTITT